MKAIEPRKASAGKFVSTPVPGTRSGFRTGRSGGRRTYVLRRERGWIFLLFSMAILISVLWWNWNREWAALESDVQPKESTPAPQAHVPAGVMAKLVTHRLDPEYPAAARPQNLAGVIVLDVVVGSDGSVVGMRPVNGPEILAQAAMDAMRWWRFEPYRVKGEPVVVETTVAMEFQP